MSFNMNGDVASNDQLDNATGQKIGIDYAHHEIHGGNHYYIEGTVDLDDTDTLYVKLVTPDTAVWSHFLWEIESSLILTTELYEAPTGGMTGGSGVTPLNNNRNSSNTSGMVITSGVTAPTATVLTISTKKWGTRTLGGASNREDEIMLKQNTTYCRKFLSGSNSNIVSFKASWYEHTNVE